MLGNATSRSITYHPRFAGVKIYPDDPKSVWSTAFANKIAKGGAAYARNTELPQEVGHQWRRLHALQQDGTFDEEWAGLLLSATCLLTGRLWLGIGLHAAWSYTQATVYSGIVSGTAPPEGFVKSTLQGSEWLTGGTFGVEASAVALAVCGTVGALMLAKAARLGRLRPRRSLGQSLKS